MEQSTRKMHPAWLVLIGLCFLDVGGFPLIFNLVGVYLVPASTAMGLDPARWTMWLSCNAIMGLIVIPIAGRLFKTNHIRLIMTVGMAICAVGIALFSVATEFWQLIVIGLLLGIGTPFAFGLPQQVLIGNWFAKKYQARMLSIAMVCVVAAPIFWAPIFTMVIANFGYQMSYLINAGCIAVLTIPWCLFAFKRSPEDMGLQPYGYVEGAENENPEEEENDSKVGVTPGQAVKTVAFWLTLVAACLICFAMGFENYSVTIAGTFLPGATPESASVFGATMISIFSIGSLVGTFLFGFMLGKDKFKLTFIVFLTMFLLGFLCWNFWHAESGLLIGAFLIGTHNGLATVGFPLLIRRLFGGKHYSVTYSYVNTCTATLGGFSSTILGILYGVFDGIGGALLFGLAIAVIIYICSMAATGFVGKIKWPAEDELSANTETEV